MVFLFVLQEAVQGQVRPTPVSQFTNVSPSALASQTPHKRARDSAPSFCIGKTCPSRALLPGWVGEIILSRTEHAISTRRVFIATQTCDFLRDFVFKGEALRRKHVLAQYAPKFFRSRPSRDDFPNKVMSSIDIFCAILGFGFVYEIHTMDLKGGWRAPSLENLSVSVSSNQSRCLVFERPSNSKLPFRLVETLDTRNGGGPQ